MLMHKQHIFQDEKQVLAEIVVIDYSFLPETSSNRPFFLIMIQTILHPYYRHQKLRLHHILKTNLTFLKRTYYFFMHFVSGLQTRGFNAIFFKIILSQVLFIVELFVK